MSSNLYSKKFNYAGWIRAQRNLGRQARRFQGKYFNNIYDIQMEL